MSIPNNKKRIVYKKEFESVFPEKPNTQRIKIPDSLLLGIIPVLVYGLMYAYESGYMSFFNIPTNYMNFEWSEILFFASVVLSALVVIGGLLNIPYMFAGLVKHPLARRRLNIIMYSAIYLLVFSYFSFSMKYKTLGYVIIGVVIFFTLVFFVFPALRKYKGGYNEKLEQSLLAMSDITNIDSPLDIVIHKFGLSTYIFIGFYLSCLPLATIAGMSSAFNKEKFYIIQSNYDCAVVYTRVSELLCVKFDKLTNEFSSGYLIYKNEDLKDVELVYENIGTLYPRPTPTKTPLPTPTETPTVIPIITATP